MFQRFRDGGSLAAGRRRKVFLATEKRSETRRGLPNLEEWGDPERRGGRNIASSIAGKGNELHRGKSRGVR